MPRRISASLQHLDFAREDIDLAIRHGDGTAVGLHVTRLCTVEVVMVCSPKLLSGKAALRKPDDLARHRLLHINDRTYWKRWRDAAGVTRVGVPRGPVLNQASMIASPVIGWLGCTTLLKVDARIEEFRTIMSSTR